MKLPWIQVTEETWANASRLAALLDCDEDKGFKLQCDLWRWGLDLGPADQPPEGICLSPRAARLLAAACCWPLARADELVGVFGDLGLVAPVDGGLRVCGLDRYHGTWRKNRGLNGAKTQEPSERRTEPERNPNGHRAEPVRKTQTQTQTQKQIEVEDLCPPSEAQRVSSPEDGNSKDSVDDDASATQAKAFVDWAKAQAKELSKPGRKVEGWAAHTFAKYSLVDEQRQELMREAFRHFLVWASLDGRVPGWGLWLEDQVWYTRWSDVHAKWLASSAARGAA